MAKQDITKVAQINRFDVVNPHCIDLSITPRGVCVKVNGAVRFQARFTEEAMVKLEMNLARVGK